MAIKHLFKKGCFYIKKRLIGIIIIFIFMFVILFIFMYNEPDLEYKIIDKDYYEQDDVLKYNQLSIDQYISTPNIFIEKAVAIAKVVFDDYDELKQPYLVYIDEENNVYIIIAEFKESDTKLKVVIDRNTGGFLLLQRLPW